MLLHCGVQLGIKVRSAPSGTGRLGKDSLDLVKEVHPKPRLTALNVERKIVKPALEVLKRIVAVEILIHSATSSSMNMSRPPQVRVTCKEVQRLCYEVHCLSWLKDLTKMRTYYEPAKAASGQVPGTMSEILKCYDQSKILVLVVHQFIKPDKSIGLPGFPIRNGFCIKELHTTVDEACPVAVSPLPFSQVY